MKAPSARNIHTQIDTVLPFSGTVAEWTAKLGLTDEALVGRALKHFSTSHTATNGKRILTHVKTETDGVWTLRRHNLGYAEAYHNHNHR